MDGPQGRGGLPDSLPRRLPVDRPSRFGGVCRCPDEAVGGLQTDWIPSSPSGPTTRLVFLGFELDTLAIEVRLPQEKLAELTELRTSG